MNFSSMDYFVMTAQEGSFTRAAERLHITQQTLSAHIANLEREVGSRLFVRSLPLELTYAGQVFWEYAVEFRRKLQFLEREMGDIAGRIGRDLLAQAGVIPKIAVESSNIETLLGLCVRGESACFCPENLMRAALPEDQLDKLVLFRLGQDVRLAIRFAYLKQEHPWSILEKFIHLATRT